MCAVEFVKGTDQLIQKTKKYREIIQQIVFCKTYCTFYLSIYLSIYLCLYVYIYYIYIYTCKTILAPGLAPRGPDSSCVLLGFCHWSWDLLFRSDSHGRTNQGWFTDPKEIEHPIGFSLVFSLPLLDFTKKWINIDSKPND